MGQTSQGRTETTNVYIQAVGAEKDRHPQEPQSGIQRVWVGPVNLFLSGKESETSSVDRRLDFLPKLCPGLGSQKAMLLGIFFFFAIVWWLGIG